MRRLAYPLGLILAAARCDIDAPRTPFAADKESQGRVYSLRSYNGVKYLVPSIRGEGIAISTSNPRRSWS